MNHVLLDLNKALEPIENDETLLTAISQSPTKYYQCEKRGFVNFEKDGNTTTLLSPGSEAKVTLMD